MSKEDKKSGGNLTVNRRASHDYFVLEKYEAGIELVGTEMGCQDDPGALGNQQFQGRQGLFDAGGVVDHHHSVLLLHRDVVIDAHQDAFAGDVQVADRKFGHKNWSKSESYRSTSTGPRVFRAIQEDRVNRTLSQSLREAGRSFSKQNPGGPKPVRGIAGDFWTQESIHRKIGDESCLKTVGPADPSDFRETSPDRSCGLIAASSSRFS